MSKHIFFWQALFLVQSVLLLWGTTKSFSLKVDDSDLHRGDTVPRQSYSTILEKSTPAVVSVTTQQVVKRMYPTIEDFLRRYYGLPLVNEPNVKEENVPVGIGSGVIVTPEGHTITNAHVITDPRTGSLVEEVLVQLSDKVEYKAQIGSRPFYRCGCT